MTVSEPAKVGLILLVIVLLVVLGILTNLIILPIETTTTTTTTVAIVPTTTTTIKETTTLTTTTMPVTINKSYCENDKCWLYEGESLDIMKDNITYRIGLVGVPDEDTAAIYVDGEIDTLDQGEDKIVKGLGIYLMKVFYLPKEEQLSFVQFLFY